MEEFQTLPSKRPSSYTTTRTKKKQKPNHGSIEELAAKLKNDQEFPVPVKVKEEEPEVPSIISSLKEYAGEGVEKYRLRDIYVYLQTGIFPQEFITGEDRKKMSEKKRTFKMSSKNYIISDKEISSVTKSRLCYYLRSDDNLRAIPLKEELETILRNIHVRNGVHTSLKRCMARAAKVKVYWPQYCYDMARYINHCSCRCAHKLKLGLH